MLIDKPTIDGECIINGDCIVVGGIINAALKTALDGYSSQDLGGYVKTGTFNSKNSEQAQWNSDIISALDGYSGGGVSVATFNSTIGTLNSKDTELSTAILTIRKSLDGYGTPDLSGYVTKGTFNSKIAEQTQWNYDVIKNLDGYGNYTKKIIFPLSGVCNYSSGALAFLGLGNGYNCGWQFNNGVDAQVYCCPVTINDYVSGGTIELYGHISGTGNIFLEVELTYVDIGGTVSSPTSIFRVNQVFAGPSGANKYYSIIGTQNIASNGGLKNGISVGDKIYRPSSNAGDVNTGNLVVDTILITYTAKDKV